MSERASLINSDDSDMHAKGSEITVDSEATTTNQSREKNGEDAVQVVDETNVISVTVNFSSDTHPSDRERGTVSLLARSEGSLQSTKPDLLNSDSVKGSNDGSKESPPHVQRVASQDISIESTAPKKQGIRVLSRVHAINTTQSTVAAPACQGEQEKKIDCVSGANTTHSHAIGSYRSVDIVKHGTEPGAHGAVVTEGSQASSTPVQPKTNITSMKQIQNLYGPFNLKNASILQDVRSACDFLRACGNVSDLAVHPCWVPGALLRDTHPIFLAFAHTTDRTFVLTHNVIESHVTLRELRMLFQSTRVRKLIWDGRNLGDYCFHRLRADMENVFDLCLSALVTGDFHDEDSGRLERGVHRIPVITDYIEQGQNLKVNAITTAHVLLRITQYQLQVTHKDVIDRVVEMSKAFTKVYVGKNMRTYARNEINWLLPLGIFDPKEVEPSESSLPGRGLQQCSNCQRHFRTECFKIRYVNKCRVCLELALPCSVEMMCKDGLCPYVHPSSQEQRNSILMSASVVARGDQTNDRKNTELPAPSATQVASSNNCHTNVSDVVEGASNLSYNPLSSTKSLSPEIPLTATKTSSPPKSDFRKGARSDIYETVSLFGTDGKSLPKIYRARNVPNPCPFFFEGGCRQGQSCPMAHEPVPVYVPIPVPRLTSPQNLNTFHPCRHFREGYCRKGQSCLFQHLPDEVLSSDGIQWGKLHKHS